MISFKIFQEKFIQVIRLEHQQRWFRQNRYAKLIALVIGFLIVVGQFNYYFDNEGITNEHRREDAGGFTHFRAKHFLYFYHYLDLFPIMSEVEKDYSKEGAQKVIDNHGETLMMEYGHWTRLGEHGRIWAFMPDSWIKGPMNPSIKTFSFAFFLAGLLSVLIGFWRLGEPLIGLIIVLLFSINPFYRYEIYAHENIFSLPSSVAMILLGLFLPLIFSKRSKWDIALIAFSGFLIAFTCNIRAENLPIIGSCLIIILFNGNYNIAKKLGYSFLLLATYVITNKSIVHHFEQKFDEAIEVVDEAGGHPYLGGRIESHRFWHPFFCGLGDFDRKYGYEWNDIVAYNYAIPVLKEEYNLDLNYSGDKYYLDEYYDEAQLYYRKFDEIDEYEEVMKNKVVTDISNDPLWYIDILLKRFNRLLTNTSPISTFFSLKGIGWLILPLLLLLWRFKSWSYFKLLIFCLPLLATSFLIYSGGNSTYNSPYHLVMIALLCSWLVEFFLIFKNDNQVERNNTV